MREALPERTERAIEACYDAALVSSLWPTALQQLCESLGAASCTFCTHDQTSLPMPSSTGHAEFADLWVRNEGHAPDPYVQRGPSLSRDGRPYVIEQQIVTAEEHRTLPYFNETARPGRREWWAVACFSVGDRSWGLPLYRDAAGGPFTHAEGQYLSGLSPHLSRAIALAEKFSEVRIASALSTLDRMNCATLLIDSRGVARYANHLADDLLGDDFYLVAGRPAARDPASNRRLQELISSIRYGGRGSVPSFAQIVIDRARTPWLLVETMPVTAFASDVFTEGRAVLLLTDLTSPPAADAAVLAAVFRLTAAEAKMAARIASGKGIDDAAAALGISRETARTQLKSVFLKTNTRSQPELVALLSRLRPALPNR